MRILIVLLSGDINAGGRRWQPDCCVQEIDEGLLIEAALPGVKREDIFLRLEDDNHLVLRGERKEEKSSMRSHAAFLGGVPYGKFVWMNRRRRGLLATRESSREVLHAYTASSRHRLRRNQSRF